VGAVVAAGCVVAVDEAFAVFDWDAASPPFPPPLTRSQMARSNAIGNATTSPRRSGGAATH
jgi:hypothetical protein